jgi:SAM-dependent methyltransferase
MTVCGESCGCKSDSECQFANILVREGKYTDNSRSMTDKLVLDATCGSRSMWFDKENELALFADKRTESFTQCDGRVLEIKPDLEMDFTDMPFEDDTFHLVVFDPPHFDKLGHNSWLAQKYGRLLSSWEIEIKAGFDECWRVTKPNGVIIFKWNVRQISISKILAVIERNPLFGHTATKNGQTIWMTFMKTL